MKRRSINIRLLMFCQQFNFNHFHSDVAYSVHIDTSVELSVFVFQCGAGLHFLKRSILSTKIFFFLANSAYPHRCWYIYILDTNSLANRENPDEMPHNATFHQCFYC